MTCVLPEEDIRCFTCSLPDCKDKHKHCPRLNCIRERKAFKQKQHADKMSTVLKEQTPTVIR